MKIVHRLLVLALLAAPVHLQASNPKVDSLLHLLETHTATDRAEVLWAVAYELFDVDNPQAVFYAERAYHEVWQKGDSLQIVKVGTTYVQLERRMGNLDHAIKIADELLPVARRHNYRKYVKILLNTLGLLHLTKEEFDRALEYNNESLAMRRLDGDSSEVIVALSNLGLIHYRLNDYHQALECLNRALTMNAYRKDTMMLAGIYSIMGAIHSETKEYSLANSFFRQAINIEFRLKDYSSLAQDFQGIATSYYRMGNLDSAKYFATEGVALAKRIKDKWSLTLCYIVLSNIALEHNQYPSSMSNITKAEEVAFASEFPYLKLEVVRQKAIHLSRIGDMKNSIQAFEAYNRGRDSIYHGEAEKRLRNVQVIHAQRENRIRIQNQANVLLLQSQLLSRQRSFILIISGLLFIVVVLAYELFRAYKKKESMNRLLDFRVAERTRELGFQRDHLQHHLDEERIIRTKVCSEVDMHVKTLQGLLHLVQMDHTGIGTYLERAKMISTEIVNSVSRLKVKEK